MRTAAIPPCPELGESGTAVRCDVSANETIEEKALISPPSGQTRKKEWIPERTDPAIDVIWIRTESDLLRRRLEFEARILADSIEISYEKKGGVPVVRGTRMPVARILAEVADNVRIKEFADNYDLDVEKLHAILQGFSVYLSRPLR